MAQNKVPSIDPRYDPRTANIFCARKFQQSTAPPAPADLDYGQNFKVLDLLSKVYEYEYEFVNEISKT